MKEEMKSLVYQIKNYVDVGINCHHLYLLKYKEMQLLFKHFYTQEEIAQIFYMSLGNSPLFVEIILGNYSKVKTSKELAHLLGYSMRQFEKLFKENFDETPYKWMQERKVKQILQKLKDPDIPLKQIMYEFKFNTSSHFNFYCKKHLGGTPMQVRNGHKDNLISK
ncbi:AraC family transcriptional regulator [Bacteroides fragilis]|nr:AraC family transcriptional regulator [Bacteroides fragilis]